MGVFSAYMAVFALAVAAMKESSRHVWMLYILKWLKRMKHKNARILEREPEIILDLKCKHYQRIVKVKYINKKTLSFIQLQQHKNECECG